MGNEALPSLGGAFAVGRLALRRLGSFPASKVTVDLGFEVLWSLTGANPNWQSPFICDVQPPAFKVAWCFQVFYFADDLRSSFRRKEVIKGLSPSILALLSCHCERPAFFQSEVLQLYNPCLPLYVHCAVQLAVMGLPVSDSVAVGRRTSSNPDGEREVYYIKTSTRGGGFDGR